MTDVTINAAATVIVLRDFPHAPKVLMGQRGAKAVFMPNKFVFPGGRVDAGDASIALQSGFLSPCDTRLEEDTDGTAPSALAACAIRELWEETGQILGRPADWDSPPTDWVDFAAKGFRPDPKGLIYFFRALTPPGRPRRFDARFFLVNADHLQSDPDDFSQASDELSHLAWVPLAEVRNLDLPFVTAVVLGEVSGLTNIAAPETVPFFKTTEEENLFKRLGGKSPLDP